jgi:hypothetical protein
MAVILSPSLTRSTLATRVRGVATTTEARAKVGLAAKPIRVWQTRRELIVLPIRTTGACGS